MKQKGFINVILIIAIAAFMSVGVYSSLSYRGLPSNVVNKYRELRGQYSRSFGATIMRCEKNNEVVYFISGSGGYSVTTFYYGEDGTELGSLTGTDAIDLSRPSPKEPIDTKEYRCSTIKRSLTAKLKL